MKVGFGRVSCSGPSDLPLSMLIGGWLTRGCGPPRFGLTVPVDAAPQRCAALGAGLAGGEAPVALLVVGDGTARRSPAAPGYFDERAEPYDRAVATALGKADLATLRDLDRAAAEDLLVDGCAPWQVLAGAAEGRSWSAELLYDDAPLGVGYFVAVWEAR